MDKLTLLVFLQIAASISAADKPHILFLLVDDWGWANVGYHREVATREVQTPNFDNLVKNGLELDQNYVFHFCSPSRSSLMTGRLQSTSMLGILITYTIQMIPLPVIQVFLPK